MSIRHGLLAVLGRTPMHGYQLRTEFETATGTNWPLNIGQVYTTLQRLERDGFVAETDVAAADVAATGPDDRRSYALTARGHQELKDWFADPVARDAVPRDELAMKLVFALLVPGVDVQAVIQKQRVETMSALQAFTRAKRARTANLAGALVADLMIFNAEAEMRWLDHCESVITESETVDALSADSATATPAAAKANRTDER